MKSHTVHLTMNVPALVLVEVIGEPHPGDDRRLDHYSSGSPEELQSDMLARSSGHFVIGRDLDVY